MPRRVFHILITATILSALLCPGDRLFAQIAPVAAPDTVAPMPSFGERAKKWGPNDTIITNAIWYNREMLTYKEEPMVWVSKLSGKKLQKYMEEWTRLRNAVYVTYPYARTAGSTINDITSHLTNVSSKKQRKEYIQSR